MSATLNYVLNRPNDAADEIDRLREALGSLTEDPPATLDEPDPDWEAIIKMRNIARKALGLPNGIADDLPTAEAVRGILAD